ncbi:MAG: hypothetical protein JG772_270 [Dysgonamonadaceae bacterium]|jgi:hypothetical protein|nr:hypothetical protein [Dysgonamonadaceae bacterium]
MPKKGELNHKEQEQESERAFRKTRHRHSAIESNINEPEHRGSDRCPDKGYSTSNDMWVWVYALTICIVLEQS